MHFTYQENGKEEKFD